MATKEELAAERWDELRKFLNEEGMKKGEWAGVPLPVVGQRLVLEPSYPYKGLQGFAFEESDVTYDEGADTNHTSRRTEGEVRGIRGDPGDPRDVSTVAERLSRAFVAAGEDDWDEVNSWFDYRRGAEVIIWKSRRGKIAHTTHYHGPGRRLKFWFNTFGVSASHAWTYEAEAAAVRKLGELLKPYAFKCYMMGGGFLETSKKSGVTYLFRKLRPTIALRPRLGQMEVIATLCLHPIGYYEESWAGVHPPTDDVISHLVLMRGDEHLFWRKANQHAMWRAESGI